MSSLLIILVITFSLASAMTISSVDVNNFHPGSEQDVTIKVKNNFNDQVTGVSLILDLSKNILPFSVISSEEDVNEIDEDDTEKFTFTIKASNDAKAGDYQASYTLIYTLNGSAIPSQKIGVFGLTVEAEPELVYTISTENSVIGSSGKIKLKIVNKGLGDAKFVEVKIIPAGYTLLSEGNSYIGTVASDDSETISFDVIFKEQNPLLNAQIEYKDFNNQKVTKSISLPVKVYSQQQALELGITKQNNTPLYIGTGIIIFIAWMIIRRIRKKKRMNKSKGR